MKFLAMSIRTKLALLAGVPVVAALLLALVVANDARQRFASAASLGSIEDLARLTSYMADLLHALEDERAASAMVQGVEAQGKARSDRAPEAEARRATDAAAERLEGFLLRRDRAKLPARLSKGLREAEDVLRALPGLRRRLDAETLDLKDSLSPYEAANAGLVGATAALSDLTDDGAILRDVEAVAALLELEERASVEDAIVGHASARGDFPPGAFKDLLTAATEEHIYDNTFRARASDQVRESFERARAHGREIGRAHV